MEKGDSDCCMYFVNKGEVNVFEVGGRTDVKFACFSKGTCFGEAQGLACIPHKYTYKAHTVVEVLILKKLKWEYLLKWFPASKVEIITRAIEEGLLSGEAAHQI